MKQRKPIRQRSQKTIDEAPLREWLRDTVVNRDQRCMAAHAWPDVPCEGRLECHHLCPKSVFEEGRFDPDNCVAACERHHDLIDLHPAYANTFQLHLYRHEGLARLAERGVA